MVVLKKWDRGIQRDFEKIGAEGCYFLSILASIPKNIDVYQAYTECIKDGLIKDNCFVNDPAAILERYWGGKWVVTKVGPDAQCPENGIEYLYFERPGHGHFVVGDGYGGVLYDPYGESKTVLVGKMKSKRIAERVSL